ncbi:hypothetical protein A2W24_00670 [Microgenomates group bacterium RBG_16_45_19]|nr:MAG: hypothetical protein A2W24_00670 [Microgenomates group bacterium RBG_16_45_19]
MFTASQPLTQPTFIGQQDGEQILCLIKAHPLALISQSLKVLAASLLLFVVIVMLNIVLPEFSSIITPLFSLTSLVIFIVGFWTVLSSPAKNLTYITDRRLVRFQATTPFTINSRTLSWQDVVKVKTFPPNFIWRWLNVGTIVAHSHSTMVNTVETKSQSVLSDDDIDIPHVHYYRDLGNYLDKILYLYHKTPKDLATLKPFVFKPRGHRD